MHFLQQKILELSRQTNIRKLSYREIGQRIGEDHAQKVKHHLEQLKKKGFLKISKGGHEIIPTENLSSNNNFLMLPIIGMANCGPALTFADEQLDGYLQLSKSIIPNYKKGEYFAIKAIGDSLNKAEIGLEKNNIEEGDYAIIQKTNANRSDLNGKYVLSVIDGMANLKKFSINGNKIFLSSVSTNNYPPIVIQEEDYQSYFVNGIVKTVIKNR